MPVDIIVIAPALQKTKRISIEKLASVMVSAAL